MAGDAGRYNRGDYNRAVAASQVAINTPDALKFGAKAWQSLHHLGMLSALAAGQAKYSPPETPMMTAKEPDVTAVDASPINAKPQSPFSDLETSHRVRMFGKLRRPHEDWE